MNPGTPYKFQEKYTTLQKARPMTQRRTCWSACYVCKMEWDETKTEYLALINLVINGKHETRFACDNCAIGLKNTCPKPTENPDAMEFDLVKMQMTKNGKPYAKILSVSENGKTIVKTNDGKIINLTVANIYGNNNSTIGAKPTILNESEI